MLTTQKTSSMMTRKTNSLLAQLLQLTTYQVVRLQ